MQKRRHTASRGTKWKVTRLTAEVNLDNLDDRPPGTQIGSSTTRYRYTRWHCCLESRHVPQRLLSLRSSVQPLPISSLGNDNQDPEGEHEKVSTALNLLSTVGCPYPTSCENFRRRLPLLPDHLLFVVLRHPRQPKLGLSHRLVLFRSKQISITLSAFNPTAIKPSNSVSHCVGKPNPNLTGLATTTQLFPNPTPRRSLNNSGPLGITPPQASAQAYPT